MDLSIIILSYNTCALTLKTLETVFHSLNNVNFQYEVIVFDNASTDDSVKKISQQFGNKVNLITSSVNLGFAKGNNEAVKKGKGRVLLFLNSDIEVIDQGISQLYDFFIAYEKEDQIVGAKLLNQDFSSQASAGPFYSLLVVFAALFLKGDYYGLTRYSPNAICKVDWVSGACFMISKNNFLKLKGFDENIFMYMEEVDLMFRAKKSDMQTVFYPQAQFIHLGTGSAKSRKEPIINVYRGFLYFYKKHHSISENIILKFFLKLKAKLGYNLGVLFKNSYLIETYAEAEKLVQASERVV